MSDVNDDAQARAQANQPMSLADLDAEQVPQPPAPQDDSVPQPPQEAQALHNAAQGGAQGGDSAVSSSSNGSSVFAANGSTDVNQVPSAAELWASLGDSDRPAGLGNSDLSASAVRSENDFSHGAGAATPAASNVPGNAGGDEYVPDAYASSDADFAAETSALSGLAASSLASPDSAAANSVASVSARDAEETSVMEPASFAGVGAGSGAGSGAGAETGAGADTSDYSSLVETPKEAAKRMEKTLRDPLITRPRKSSVVLDAVFGAVLLVLSGLTWFLAVRTLPGQEFDNLVWTSRGHLNVSLFQPIVRFFTHSMYDVIIIAVLGVLAFVIAAVRKRWVLLLQMAIFVVVCAAGGFAAKKWLPRPELSMHIANPANSSPSGHSLAAMTVSIVLIMAVPLAWRWVASIIGALFSICVGMSVVIGGWHRPSDVVVAFLFVSGLALITMAFTRNSGMDKPGARHSSPMLQIIETVMITLGIAGVAYGIYLIVQIFPALSYESLWAVHPAIGAATVMIVSVALLTMGLVTSLWQVTAAPLSAVGLVGAPPAPPSQDVSQD